MFFDLGFSRHDPFEECSVNNCIFTGNDSLLNTANAVMVHLHTALIPKTEKRNPVQKWIFLDDESPKNSFALAKKKPKLSELSNVFNWSMSYRLVRYSVVRQVVITVIVITVTQKHNFFILF